MNHLYVHLFPAQDTRLSAALVPPVACRSRPQALGSRVPPRTRERAACGSVWSDMANRADRRGGRGWRAGRNDRSAAARAPATGCRSSKTRISSAGCGRGDTSTLGKTLGAAETQIKPVSLRGAEITIPPG